MRVVLWGLGLARCPLALQGRSQAGGAGSKTKKDEADPKLGGSGDGIVTPLCQTQLSRQARPMRRCLPSRRGVCSKDGHAHPGTGCYWAAASSPGGSQFPGLPAPPVGHHRGAEPFLSLCSSRWGHRELPNSEQPSCHGDGRTCGEPYPCSAPLGPLPLCSDGAGLPPGPAGLFLTVCHVLPEHN